VTDSGVAELWALLHFIMPSLFDSHEEFNDWFAKDADPNDKSGSHGLNEHQVRRLHMILKPFMLRRVKKHVQNELGEKVCLALFILPTDALTTPLRSRSTSCVI